MDGIAICDHNTAENVDAVRKAGQKQGLFVLRGMEICSSEEVHILALFDNDDALMQMQKIVYDNLPGENNEEYFGEQIIVDENDRVIGSTKKMLIGATTMGVNKVVSSIKKIGGLAVASHVDRDSFSIIAQLGFVPEELKLDALEVSWRCKPDETDQYKSHSLPFITSSDSHFLADIGKASAVFLINELSFTEVAMALKNVEGRTVSI